MPASNRAAPRAARTVGPAANPAAGPSHLRVIGLLLAGIVLAGGAWWFRSSPWMRERVLQGMDLPALEAAARRRPDDPLIQYHLAKQYYLARRFSDARAAYQRVVQIEPRSARAHLGLGLCLYETGALRDADAELDEALRIDPRLAWPEYMLGKIAWLRGRTGEALPHVKRSTELDARSDQAWYALAVCYLGLRRYEEAIDALRQAIARNGASASYQTALGEVLVYRGHTDEGRQYYERAMQLDPNYGPACALMGSFYLRKVAGLDAQDHAEQLLLRATRLKTYHPEQVHLDLGDLYLQKGEFRKAIDALNRSVRSDPRDERPYFGLAKAYRALGKNAAAQAAQAKFERISKMHVELQTQEARVFHNPGDTRARLALARLYEGIGMLPQAEEQYLAYLRMKPNDTDAAASLQRLLAQSSAAAARAGAREFTLPPLR